MTIKMKAPKDFASITIGDNNFVVNDGLCELPMEYMDVAMEHGFLFLDLIEQENIEESKIEEKKTKKSNKKDI